jgi:hypothetical protein
MYRKLTRAKPREIDGVVFRCYEIGIFQYEWRSDDGRLDKGRPRRAGRKNAQSEAPAIHNLHFPTGMLRGGSPRDATGRNSRPLGAASRRLRPRPNRAAVRLGAARTPRCWRAQTAQADRRPAWRARRPPRPSGDCGKSHRYLCPHPHRRLFFKTAAECGAVDPARPLVLHSQRGGEKISARTNPGPAAAIAGRSCQLRLGRVKIGRR